MYYCFLIYWKNEKNLFSLSILAIALTTGSCINDLNEGQTPGANYGDLTANIPIGGDTVRGSTATDIIGDDDALYAIPQTNPASSLNKTAPVDGAFIAPSEFYIEITYKEVGQTDADIKTYAVPVPAIVGDAYASSIAFEMERQYTFQFELFGRNPIRITKITVSDYDTVEQEETLRLTWAGSNIYWDGTKLTFADSGDKTKEQYQGVFFKWGSLVGVSPNGGTWSPQKAYVPDITAPDGSWSEDDTMPWAITVESALGLLLPGMQTALLPLPTDTSGRT